MWAIVESINSGAYGARGTPRGEVAKGTGENQRKKTLRVREVGRCAPPRKATWRCAPGNVGKNVVGDPPGGGSGGPVS